VKDRERGEGGERKRDREKLNQDGTMG